MAAATAVLLAGGAALGYLPPHLSAATTPQGTGERPSVYSTAGFGDSQSSSVASPPVVAQPGDAVLVWFGLHGNTHPVAVTDSSGDAFHQLMFEGMSFGLTGAYHALALWAATNVVGGSSVEISVTQTSCTACLLGSAVVVADITGVGPWSTVGVGPPASSSGLPGQQSDTFACEVATGSPSLVLAGVAGRNSDDFAPGPGEQRLAQQLTVGTTLFNSVTLAVLEVSSSGSARPQWVNGTDNQTTAWLAEAVTVQGGASTSATAMGHSGEWARGWSEPGLPRIRAAV